jgi:CheY-like chemotaxis protein
VLVIDDLHDSCTVLKRLLDALGCEALTCTDSRQAVEAAKSASPQLILLDLRMPGVDGYSVAKELRQAKLPLFVLAAYTGLSDKNSSERCFEAGFDTILLKPASVDQLRALIDTAAELPRPEA